MRTFKRKLYTKLLDWKNNRQGRTAVLIEGARRVGKTTLARQFATGNDWWFHAKGMPGSHVVVKTNNETDLPDRMFEEAGKLAGYYSSGRDSDKIEIDYLQKKNVKKPNGSAPGFVVYYTNFSLTVHPDISGLTLVE